MGKDCTFNDTRMKLSTQLEVVFEKILGYRDIADSSCGGVACIFN